MGGGGLGRELAHAHMSFGGGGLGFGSQGGKGGGGFFEDFEVTSKTEWEGGNVAASGSRLRSTARSGYIDTRRGRLGSGVNSGIMKAAASAGEGSPVCASNHSAET